MKPMPSDEEAVEQVKAGDRDSYGVLAMRYQPRLRRLAQAFMRHSADVEDAVQAAHLQAWQHIDQYEGRSPYVHWMTTITINEVRTAYRRNRVGVAAEELEDHYTAPGPNPEQAAIGKEIVRVVESALDRIPPAYSSVFRMREMADLSTAETGRSLGLSEACVKSRLLRARSMLRRVIEMELRGSGRRWARRPQEVFAFGGLDQQTGSVA